MGAKVILCERSGGATKLSTHNDKFVVSGVFSQADTLNRNGRIYSHKLWESLLSNPELKESIKNRTMVGELGHPEQLETTPVQISHIVTKLELHPDGTVYGEAEILDTPSGRILKTLYEAGVKVGISSRGFLDEGYNLYPDENNNLIVPEGGYELITFDFVIDPSSPDAYPTLKESAIREMNTILCENRNRVNPDISAFITSQTTGKKPLTEKSQKAQSANQHKVPKTRTTESKKLKKQLEEALLVTKGIRERYLMAEEIITDLVKERDNLIEMAQIAEGHEELASEVKDLTSSRSNDPRRLAESIRRIITKADNRERQINEISRKAKTIKAQRDRALEEAETANRAMQNLMMHNRSLEKELDDLDSEAEYLWKDNADISREIRTARLANDNLKAHNGSLSDKIDIVSQQVESMSRINRSLKVSLTEHFVQLKEAEAKYTTAETAKKHLEMHVSKLETENEQLGGEIAELERDIKTAENANRNLEAHLKAAERDNRELIQELEKFNTEFATAKNAERNERIHKGIATASDDKEIEALEAENDGLVAENRQLRANLKKLKAAYNRDIALADSDSAELIRENRELRARLTGAEPSQRPKSKAVLSEMARSFNVSTQEVSRIYDMCKDPESATRLYFQSKKAGFKRTRALREEELPTSADAITGIYNRESYAQGLTEDTSQNEYDIYERAAGIAGRMSNVSDALITESVIEPSQRYEREEQEALAEARYDYSDFDFESAAPKTAKRPKGSKVSFINEDTGLPQLSESSLMNIITATMSGGNMSLH